MGVIQDLQNYVLELQNKVLLLQEKVKDLEIRLPGNPNKIDTPNQTAPSPSLTKTLDSNNIYIGDKGTTEYTNLAKLDVIYDSVDDKWRPFECVAGVVPLEDADFIVTLMWSSVDKKFIVYKNPPYSIYYPG